jgi:hypothetical protein
VAQCHAWGRGARLSLRDEALLALSGHLGQAPVELAGVYRSPFSWQNTRLSSRHASPAARRSLACRCLWAVSAQSPAWEVPASASTWASCPHAPAAAVVDTVPGPRVAGRPFRHLTRRLHHVTDRQPRRRSHVRHRRHPGHRPARHLRAAPRARPRRPAMADHRARPAPRARGVAAGAHSPRAARAALHLRRARGPHRAPARAGHPPLGALGPARDHLVPRGPHRVPRPAGQAIPGPGPAALGPRSRLTGAAALPAVTRI